MINPGFGDIAVDGTVLQGGMPERAFLSSSVGNSAKSGLTTAGYQWYQIRSVANGSPWSFSLCFHHERLEFVSLAPQSSSQSWSDFSEESEKLTAEELRYRVREWLGCPPSRQQNLMDTYSFSWGSVSVGLVPQNATASIGVRYTL